MGNRGRIARPVFWQKLQLFSFAASSFNSRFACAKSDMVASWARRPSMNASSATRAWTLLYLNFRLTLSVVMDMERWDCPAACRRQDSGAPELDTLWHRFVAESVGSLSRAACVLNSNR